MSTTEIGTALTAAVERMAQNRSNPGTAVTRAAEGPPRIGIVTGPGGAVLLPAAIPLPPLPDDKALRSAMLTAIGDPAGVPSALTDERGGVVWLPSKALPLVAAAPVRAAASEHADRIGRILAPLAEDALIQEWLQRWAPNCNRRNDQDYFAWEQGVLLAVRSLPAIVFSDETAVLAAQSPTFRWLPAPPDVFGFLTAWLAPYRDTLAAARRVVAANEPAPTAREALPGAPLTEDQAAERKAAIAGTMQRFRETMAATREKLGRPTEGRPTPRYLSPLDLALTLKQQLSSGPPETASAARMRLAVLLRQHPDIADLLEPVQHAAPRRDPEQAEATGGRYPAHFRAPQAGTRGGAA